jgi:hypothetical protein
MFLQQTFVSFSEQKIDAGIRVEMAQFFDERRSQNHVSDEGRLNEQK